jgi:hypothetical protein
MASPSFRQHRTVLAASLFLAILLLGTPGAGFMTAFAAPPKANIPYRFAFGRPTLEVGARSKCYLWLEGGRLHLRLTGTERRPRIEGEIRTSLTGKFEDPTPLSEELRLRQPRPSKIMFYLEAGPREEGFDVALAGDYNHVTLDLFIDGQQAAEDVHVGGSLLKPEGLPVRIRIGRGARSFLDRLGL